MSNKTILVTGGAGYIGSHTVRQLGEAGEKIVVLDNLSTGFEASILSGDFVHGDTGNSELVSNILNQYDVDTVVHFAAHTIVPESVSDPLKYYWNNTCSSRNPKGREGFRRFQTASRRPFHPGSVSFCAGRSSFPMRDRRG